MATFSLKALKIWLRRGHFNLMQPHTALTAPQRLHLPQTYRFSFFRTYFSWENGVLSLKERLFCTKVSRISLKWKKVKLKQEEEIRHNRHRGLRNATEVQKVAVTQVHKILQDLKTRLSKDKHNTHLSFHSLLFHGANLFMSEFL